MEPQKLGNSPEPGPESRQRVRSWIVQIEMRGVLGPVSTDVAERILDSADPRERRTLQ